MRAARVTASGRLVAAGDRRIDAGRATRPAVTTVARVLEFSAAADCGCRAAAARPDGVSRSVRRIWQRSGLFRARERRAGGVRPGAYARLTIAFSCSASTAQGSYFLSDRLTAHRFLRVNFFVPSEFPNPDFTLDAVVADLAARRPKYLIFEQLHSSSEMGRMVDSLQSRDEIKRLLALTGSRRRSKTSRCIGSWMRPWWRRAEQIAGIRAGLCADPYGNLLFAWPSAHSSPASRGRTVRTSPSCCSTRVTRSPASCAARARRTCGASSTCSTASSSGPADLLDQLSLIKVIAEVRPHELYNLAAMSFVPASWDQPMLTGEFNAQGVTRVLEAIRQVDPEIRFYQASSSEMFGKVREVPQTELTPFYPRSPYGVSKVFAHYITVNYRESYNLFAVSGILFNHESPRRGLEFVTRKVTDGVARIKLGLADHSALGNLDAQRDWGFAGDYVRAMWLMLQQDQPDDYVIATGESHSVRELVEVAFGHVGLDWQEYVRLDPKFLRPAEVDHLIGDAAKGTGGAGLATGGGFSGSGAMMVDADLARLARAPGTPTGVESR